MFTAFPEVGGTSVLLLSDVPAPTRSAIAPIWPRSRCPTLTWNVLHKLPKWVGIGGVLMSGILADHKRREEVKAEGRPSSAGIR